MSIAFVKSCFLKYIGVSIGLLIWLFFLYMIDYPNAAEKEGWGWFKVILAMISLPISLEFMLFEYFFHKELYGRMLYVVVIMTLWGALIAGFSYCLPKDLSFWVILAIIFSIIPLLLVVYSLYLKGKKK